MYLTYIIYKSLNLLYLSTYKSDSYKPGFAYQRNHYLNNPLFKVYVYREGINQVFQIQYTKTESIFTDRLPQLIQYNSDQSA